ncbi:DMT family transporter [Thermopolyspora sp. NPDC052614]|uniref:DMT family transporter n=1 Tax=Thermopolyspora sp. NPDC052614 TaxID=3155682 RepID=UPI0034398DA4
MLLGITIALVGALGYALGAALQQHVAVADGATLQLVKRPRWWIGGAIGFAGATLHAVALSFAPLIVIQPVSVTTLVFAVPLAAMLYGRRPHRLEIIGSIAVTAGLLGLMMLVPTHNVTPVLTNREAVGFIAVVGLVVVVCYLFARRLTGAAKALALAVPAGAVTASVSTFVRVVGGGLEGDFSRLLHWFTLAVPVLLVWAVVLLQKSYAVGYFGVAYAVVQVVDPVTSILAGVLLLGEPVPTGVGNVIPAILASGVLIVGTVMLGRMAPDHLHAQKTTATPVPVTVP